MPPWNAAGTRPNSGSVTEAGSVSRKCPAVPCTSCCGSSGSAASRSDGPASMPRQNDASDTTAASRDRAASRPAQLRNDVLRAGSDTASACRHRPPRRRKVRHQDPPRHPVHRQMVDHQQQAAGPLPLRRRTTPPRPDAPSRDRAGPRRQQLPRRSLTSVRPHRARPHPHAAHRPRHPPRPAASTVKDQPSPPASSRSRSAS